MRIAEAFCKMRLSEYCSSQDIDRAIAVTVDSFVGSQKVSCKKALSRAFAKYVFLIPLSLSLISSSFILTFFASDTHSHDPSRNPSVVPVFPCLRPINDRLCDLLSSKIPSCLHGVSMASRGGPLVGPWFNERIWLFHFCWLQLCSITYVFHWIIVTFILGSSRVEVTSWRLNYLHLTQIGILLIQSRLSDLGRAH